MAVTSREDSLLDEISRLRRALDHERETLNLERGERARERQLEADAYRAVERERDDAAAACRIVEADCDRLRALVADLRADLADERARHRQTAAQLAATRDGDDWMASEIQAHNDRQLRDLAPAPRRPWWLRWWTA